MKPKPEGTLRRPGEKPQYNLGSDDGGYDLASGTSQQSVGAGYDTSFDPLPEIAGPSPFVGEGGIFGGGDLSSIGQMLASAPYDEPVISAFKGGDYMVADSGGTMSDAIPDSDFREAVARQREQAQRDLTGGAEMRAVDPNAGQQRVRDFIQGMTGTLSLSAGWTGGVASMFGASDETIFKATMLGADLGMAASPFLAARFGMLSGEGRISLSPGQVSTAGETAATATGKSIHRQLAAERRASGDFDLVNQPLSDALGNPIMVTKRVDLATGKPLPESGYQISRPDAVRRDVIIDDKPVGRPIAKDQQEIIRFIRAYEESRGALPRTIGIQRYDSSTGRPVVTELYGPNDFLP